MPIRDDAPPEDEPQDLARRLAASLKEYPAELSAVRRILEENEAGPAGDPPRPRGRKVSDPEGRELPPPMLKAAGQTGMVLPQGTVAILAAEGGIGKSTLTGSIALGIAMASRPLSTHDTAPIEGNIFEGRGGPVLIGTYEDTEPVTRWRIHQLAEALAAERGDNKPLNACEHITVIGMSGWPLYGPPQGVSYSARPTTQEGWSVLWEAAAAVDPSLIIVDPAMDAYVGEPNSVNSIREFYKTIYQGLASYTPQAGLILTAHSTKTARSSGGNTNPFDPGMVSGSGAWTDTPRGAMTMTWDEDEETRILAIMKSNLGPQRIIIRLDQIRHRDGYLLGLKAKGDWHKPNSKQQSKLEDFEKKYANL